MRTAVVTGSASGLGAAIRTRLESDDWRVIGVDLRGADVEADLGVGAGREAMVAAVGERLSSDGIDGLEAVVACAGVGPQAERTELIVSVNYFGAVATLDGLAPHLRRGADAAALAIASNSLGVIPPDEVLVAACQAMDEDAARSRAVALDGATVYANAKLSLARWVRRQAVPWGAERVRLNALAPGPMETPLLDGTRADPVLGPHVDTFPIPLERTAQPAEIAETAAFLLGPGAALVHGAVLFADGGTDAQFRPDHA